MKKHLTLALTLLTLICSSAQAQLPSYLPADGLVGWWPFNGNANDESGNGHNCSVVEAILSDDRFGNSSSSYKLSGSTGYVRTNNPFYNSSIDHTVSFWIQVADSTDQNVSFFNTDPHTIEAFGYNYYLNPARHFHFFLGNGVNGIAGWSIALNSSFNGQPPLPSFNHWFNYTVVLEGLQWRFYINGELVNTFNSTQATSNVLADLFFGNDAVNTSAINGSIDDIAIYNRALTETEIQNLYTGTTPAACLDLPANLQDGLVGYWPFCGNANDESGNGNNGTVNGATLAEDRFGNAGSAYGFDGISNCIDVQHSSSLSIFGSQSASTISLWFYPESNQPADLINKGFHSDVASFGNKYLSLTNDAVGYQYTLYDFSTLNSVRSSDGYINTQQWYHMLIVRGANMKVYVNGIDVTTSTNDEGWSTNYNLVLDNTNMSFGCRNNKDINNAPFQNLFYQGKIDDITIYNRALSPEEVTQLYAVQSTGDPTAGGGNVTTGPLSNVPRGISYQAVARDAQGQAIAGSAVNVRFTLHQGTPTGTTEYSETHALTTNEIGLFHTFFGAGTAITSAFDSIVWSNTTKFLQVEIDLGNGYVDMGTQQLMSVPYAYRANEAAAAGTIRNNALPIYPDNTAALAGGLVAGEMYRTATGDLKIVY